MFYNQYFQNTKPYVNIGWLIRETKCWNEYAFLEATEAEKTYEMYFQNPKILEGLTGYGNKTNYAQQLDLKLQCKGDKSCIKVNIYILKTNHRIFWQFLTTIN